jgi:hypothetical protein
LFYHTCVITVHHISYYSIEMMKESGILKKLNTKYNAISRVVELPDTQTSFEDILQVLVIFMIGGLASIVCLLIEIVVLRFRYYLSGQIFNTIFPFLD